MRKIALCCTAACLSGCFSSYVQPEAASPSATLTFVHSSYGTSAFTAFADAQCSNGSNLGRLATLDIVRANEQTVRVPAGKELFVKSWWLHTAACGSGGAPNTINMCQVQCTAMDSFVPQANVHYRLSVEATAQGCQLAVENVDTGYAEPIQTHPMQEACRPGRSD